MFITVVPEFYKRDEKLTIETPLYSTGYRSFGKIEFAKYKIYDMKVNLSRVLIISKKKCYKESVIPSVESINLSVSFCVIASYSHFQNPYDDKHGLGTSFHSQ
jgi:hypothetical protein